MINSYEHHVLAWLRDHLINATPKIAFENEQIKVEDIYMECETPEDARLAILFRVTQRPQCIFGYRVNPSPPQILTTAGKTLLDEYPEGNAEVIYANFIERIEASTPGLPQECIATGITWI